MGSASQGRAGLSGLVHEKCPAAPRQAEDGARGQELGPASPHRTPTLMAPGARDGHVLSIYDLGGKFLSQAVGLARFVTAGRKLVTVYACVPLSALSALSCLMF